MFLTKVQKRRFQILVLGGSQGAHQLNLRMIEAMEQLHEKFNIRVVHQTGAKDEEKVRAAYAQLNVEAEVSAFMKDMAPRYGAADLVVCRAGATTLAELMIAGCASILIPFPFATDNHQELNGQAMVSAGAAIMFPERDLEAQTLSTHISELANDIGKRTEMKQAALSMGRPQAAKDIIAACKAIIAEGGR